MPRAGLTKTNFAIEHKFGVLKSLAICIRAHVCKLVFWGWNFKSMVWIHLNKILIVGLDLGCTTWLLRWKLSKQLAGWEKPDLNDESPARSAWKSKASGLFQPEHFGKGIYGWTGRFLKWNDGIPKAHLIEHTSGWNTISNQLFWLTNSTCHKIDEMCVVFRRCLPKSSLGASRVCAGNITQLVRVTQHAVWAWGFSRKIAPVDCTLISQGRLPVLNQKLQ